MTTAAVGSDTLGRLLVELFDGADAYAIGRLLDRRPDLDRPPEPRTPVPAEEELRVWLDRLGFVAFIQRGLALASDVHVAVVLHAGATWGQVAEVLRCTVEEAQERYEHLAVLADQAPTPGPEGGEVG